MTSETMALGQWVLCAVFMVKIGIEIFKFADQRKAQQRDVRILAECPTKEEYDRYVEWNREEHGILFEQIKAVERHSTSQLSDKIDNLRRENKSDHKDLMEQKQREQEAFHNRMDKVFEAIGELKNNKT